MNEEQKKERTLEIIKRLKNEYPDADCTLDYDDAWKLLVSVRLAAQCIDARVNVVVEDLYKKFPSVDALAAANVDEIEEIVRPCGLGKSKARDISACMKMLKEEYGGKVPDDFNKLLALPGVGRKSANLIMGDVFSQTRHCYGYPLHSTGEPDGTCRWYQGSEEGGDGAVETGTAGRGQ